MQRLTSKKTLLGTGAILGLVSMAHYFGWLKPLENSIQKYFLPFFSSSHSLSIKLSDRYEFFSDRDHFFRSYEQCVENLQNQGVLTASVEVLRQENEELKKELNFKKSSSLAIVGATVVGNDLNDTEKTIMIDRGSVDGLKINQPVTVGEGVLVGKITKVEDRFSLARLLPDNRSKIIAALLNQEKSTGIVEGGYGLSLKLKFIPRNEIVSVGQQVITSGLESGVPRGLLIGTIAAIENEAYQPFQQALITPSVDFSKLNLVNIIIN